MSQGAGMTEGGPPRQKRGLKTWSSLGQLGRIPSEYEIVTHNLNYTTRPNRTAALESNPTTAANMWFLTYRDKSPMRADDWRSFRDPDEMTYRKYVTMQDEQETAVERVLDEYGSAGHDASLPAPWVACLATLFTPTRFPVHALQMCTAYLGHMAPASYMSSCAVFGAGDLLRRVSMVANRTRQLADAGTSAGGTERGVWERHEAIAIWCPFGGDCGERRQLGQAPGTHRGGARGIGPAHANLAGGDAPRRHARARRAD
jgi:toluene monooxygenase system protein E